jgi:hypothetical protein
MSRDLFPREVAPEPGFSAEIRRVDARPFYYVIETWSSVLASQQYSLPMSQLGQSRHFGRRPTTSGLPAGADIATAGRHVSKGPIELKKSFFADD